MPRAINSVKNGLSVSNGVVALCKPSCPSQQAPIVKSEVLVPRRMGVLDARQSAKCPYHRRDAWPFRPKFVRITID